MFKNQLAAYLTGFSTKRDQKAEDKPLLVVLSFTVQPFTEDLCKEIAPEFARRFFNTGGVRVPNLGGLWFSVKEAQQRFTWQTAPGDMPVIANAVNTSVWLMFEVEQEGLLHDKVDETPRVKKGRKADAETTGAMH
jgi:hypothetical protein